MRDLAERVCFGGCLALGRILRSAKYATTETVALDTGPHVRKQRRFYAPLLVWLGGPLVRILDTGVSVLPQRAWEERERALYRTLYGAAIDATSAGTLALPQLAGITLASLLGRADLDGSARMRAIALAAGALAGLHRAGVTHGDAMAENVLVDLDADAARWFDFETVHDPRRSAEWRRTDDVRALLATCLARSTPDAWRETLDVILDAYGDERMTRLLAACFTPVVRRPLPFHLAQASLSFEQYREIGRLLAQRAGD